MIVVDPLLARDVGRAAGVFVDGSPQPVHPEIDRGAVLARIACRIGSARFAEATGLPARTAKRIKAGVAPRPGTVARALDGLRRRGLSLAGALDLAERDPLACAWAGCAEPVREFGTRCREHQAEHDRLRKRRERAAVTRGVPCRCGTTVGFGDVKPGWHADCCPSGRRRAQIGECPACGALLLGGAIDAPGCFACGSALYEEPT